MTLQNRTILTTTAAMALLVAAPGAWAQSSSLYVNPDGENALQRRQAQQQQQAAEARTVPSQRPTLGGARAAQQRGTQQQQAGVEQRVEGRVVHPQLQETSFTAVPLPEPRHFAEQDLVTVIIREHTSATSSQELSTTKETEIDSALEAMPRLQLRDLLNFQMRAGDTEDLPAFGLSHENEFDGEGDYSRQDEMTTRLTARVVDVKPNGTLALEARTHIRTDDETQTIVVTGYCRSDDITGDNTILSTQMFDLRVEREHNGELRRASRKGVLTRLLDTVLNF